MQVLRASLRRITRTAASEFRRAIESTSTLVLEFDEFGKERIKSFRLSPDAFVQLALQVAMVQRFGRCKSVYESASTRRFRHGRTETLRPVSNESRQFVQDLLTPDGEAIAARIPGARCVLVPEAGHAVSMEAPGPVTSAITDHLHRAA